jgi:hypothetical protein
MADAQSNPKNLEGSLCSGMFFSTANRFELEEFEGKQGSAVIFGTHASYYWC